MPAPRFDLPGALQSLFRGSSPRVAGSWGRWSAAVADVARRHRVLPLVIDADGLLALDATGRVVAVRWTSGAEPVPVPDVRTRDLAVLRGVSRYRQLRALVPARSAGDLDCRCLGVAAFEPTMPELVCVCGGLGFFPARWHDSELENEPEAPPPRSSSPRLLGTARLARTARDAPPASALAVEPDHVGGAGALAAISAARAIAAAGRPRVRTPTPVGAMRGRDAPLHRHWPTRRHGVRRLALAVLLALICSALIIGWSAWA